MVCVACRKAERRAPLYLCDGCIANLGRAPKKKKAAPAPQASAAPLLKGGGGTSVEQSRRFGVAR